MVGQLMLSFPQRIFRLDRKLVENRILVPDLR